MHKNNCDQDANDSENWNRPVKSKKKVNSLNWIFEWVCRNNGPCRSNRLRLFCFAHNQIRPRTETLCECISAVCADSAEWEFSYCVYKKCIFAEFIEWGKLNRFVCRKSRSSGDSTCAHKPDLANYNFVFVFLHRNCTQMQLDDFS